MIFHLGPQSGLADGIVLVSKLKKEQKIAMIFIDEGVAVNGNFHKVQNFIPFEIYLFYFELKLMVRVCIDQLESRLI